MKKILLILLLLFLIPLSACGKVKYEFKDGVMYEDGKEATGTFEVTINGFKSKGKFINGLANEIEVYYSDGSILRKDIYVNGEFLGFQVYYRNGKLMSTYLKDKRMDIFYDDGQLLMRFDKEKGENTVYFENGNPLLVIVGTTTSTLYNENKEVLSRIENGIRLDDDITFKNLEDGSFEIIKNNKVIGKISAYGTPTYFYSTGETLMKLDNSVYKTLFKNGNTFFERDGNITRFYYKDGKLLYESKGKEWTIYNREGEKIITAFDEITDIKKID